MNNAKTLSAIKEFELELFNLTCNHQLAEEGVEALWPFVEKYGIEQKEEGRKESLEELITESHSKEYELRGGYVKNKIYRMGIHVGTK